MARASTAVEPIRIKQDDPYVRKVEGWGKCRRKRAVFRFIEIEDPVRVETDRGWMVGNPGDYLMEDPRGKLSVCPRGRFAKDYDDYADPDEEDAE